VLADLRHTSPDLTLHGGDLADGGSSPVEIVDRIRDLGWKVVGGNTDEMLFRPVALDEFAKHAPRRQPVFDVVREVAAWSRGTLGAERLAWMARPPRVQVHGAMALVHASSESLWRAPMPGPGDDELEAVYGLLRQAVVVYGHIHRHMRGASAA